MSIQKRAFTTVIEAQGDEPSITISTATPDRDRDVVVPSGIDLTAYRRNPVVLFSHNSRDLPVGSTTSIEVSASGVRARWRWLANDEFADRVRNAFEQGVLRAASIGFRPIEYKPIEGGGYRFTSVELLEWSLTPIPANSEAVKTLKHLGLLDRDEPVLMFDDGDDDTFTLDPDDLRLALLSTLPDVVRDVIGATARRLVRSELDRRRGRIVDADDLALLDSDSRRVRRAEIGASVAEHIRAAVRQGLDRARGRVD
jgi:HK97 family phage prohead protease